MGRCLLLVLRIKLSAFAVGLCFGADGSKSKGKEYASGKLKPWLTEGPTLIYCVFFGLGCVTFFMHVFRVGFMRGHR